MAELKDIIESDKFLTFESLGKRLRPALSNEVPTRTIFLNADGPNIRLCLKDGNGDVFKFRMQAV